MKSPPSTPVIPIQMKSLNPSRAYLRKLSDPPATILDHLDERFPGVGRHVWLERIVRGTVRIFGGEPITPETPYQAGATVLYYREIEDEPDLPVSEQILFRNEHILVADKPHFLPVTPAGDYVNQTLLARLQRTTGLSTLTPVHRLDRDTAGLVLFVLKPELRARYHKLFADQEVEKEYLAVAHIRDSVDELSTSKHDIDQHDIDQHDINQHDINQHDPSDQGLNIPEREWLIENRLVQGEPWFRMKIVEGDANSSTVIRLVDRLDQRGLFRLFPRTGKKHQLRVHLASLGFPIVNDRVYPDVSASTTIDYTRPLQLLGNRLAFRDPVTGERMEFVSEREMVLAE